MRSAEKSFVYNTQMRCKQSDMSESITILMSNSQDFCNTRVVLIKLLKHTKVAICGSSTTSI